MEGDSSIDRLVALLGGWAWPPDYVMAIFLPVSLAFLASKQDPR